MSIMRNSKIKNKGQEKWLKAQKIIPGGNMLLSKRPDLFQQMASVLQQS